MGASVTLCAMVFPYLFLGGMAVILLIAAIAP